MGRRRNLDQHLPPRMYRKRGRYFYVRKSDSKWIKLGDTIKDAIVEYERITGQATRVPPDSWVHQLYIHSKKTAKKRGKEFTITEDDILSLAEGANNRCMVSGIPFDFDWSKEYTKRPWAPSVDRIDSSKGYTKDNIRLVVIAVNFALNEWGEDVLLRVGRYVTRKNRHLLDV